MSVIVTARVWKHSRHRGTIKLLLLALADFANDAGVCWPGAAKLAECINENERYTRLLIKKLIETEDLIAVPGGGRGHTTTYGVATGMSDRQRQHLNSVLQNTVTKNTDNEETVISGDENSVLPCQETVYYSSEGEAPNSAPQSVKQAQFSEVIRHVDPSVDPSIASRIASRAPPTGDHPRLMAAYQEALGYKIPNGAKEATAAKKILAAGYTVDQALDVYQTLKAGYWQDKHLSLHKVYEEIGAQCAAPKAGTNGTYPNGRATTDRRPPIAVRRTRQRLDGG